MIVITDGESHDSPDLEKVIQQSEKDNVTRYAVAVSSAQNHLHRACPIHTPPRPADFLSPDPPLSHPSPGPCPTIL